VVGSEVDKEGPTPGALLVGEPVEATTARGASATGHVTADPRHRHHASHPLLPSRQPRRPRRSTAIWPDVLVRLAARLRPSAAAMFSPERRMMFFLRSTKDQHVVGPSGARDVAGVETSRPRHASSVGLRVLEVAPEKNPCRGTFRSAPPGTSSSPSAPLGTLPDHGRPPRGLRGHPAAGRKARACVDLARLDACRP